MRVPAALPACGLLLACGLAAAGPGAPPTDVSGIVRYLEDGVEVSGRKLVWKEIRSLEDVAPSAEAVRAEFQRRRQARAGDLHARLRLAEWARENGFVAEADAECEAVLALDAENAPARTALGWVRIEKEWQRSAEVFAERRRALVAGAKGAKLELARWCGEHGCPEAEWTLLVELAVADPWDKGMIARVKPIVARRRQRTALVPPLAGRWRAEVDWTGHHQVKVFAIEAIDFRKLSADGKRFQGTGKRLEDWYGYDDLIYACADGTVTNVEDGFPDLPPGVGGKFEEANAVDIEHDATESTGYGHIRRGSALVKVGDVVKAGQPIARVGNSGASGLPHLHFSLDLLVRDGTGNSEWISVPWRLQGFRVVEAGRAACDFEAKVARVPEGWTVLFPPPK